MTVFKTDLIEKVAADARISKAAAGRAVESVIATVVDNAKEGNSVQITGFGTFKPCEYKGSTALGTGKKKAYDVKSIRFTTGDTVKKVLN